MVKKLLLLLDAGLGNVTFRRMFILKSIDDAVGLGIGMPFAVCLLVQIEMTLMPTDKVLPHLLTCAISLAG